MAEWVWEARGRTGEVRKGIMEADTADTVQTRLRAQQLNPVNVKKKPKEINLQFGTGIEEKDLVLFVRQFATMIDAGLPLVQCLEILAGQGDNLALNTVLKDIKGFVEQGGTFSDGLKRHPKVFDDLFVNLVEAGEHAGALETVLEKIATYKEKTEALKKKIKKALFYPAAVLAVAVIVTVVLLIFVIPQFESLFKGFGADLPAFTQFVVNMSRWMQTKGWMLLFIVGGLVFAFSYFYKRSRPMRQFIDRMSLGIPVIGPILKKAAIARFTRTLATMFGAGVPLVEAMKSVAGATGNILYQDATLRIRDEISTGMRMQRAMENTGLFPNMVVQMIAVGEESGSLDEMASKVADFYEADVDAAVDGLSSLLEPMIMVILGVLVGGLVIAMYLPIFKLGAVI